jgi:hypothetical protein
MANARTDPGQEAPLNEINRPRTFGSAPCPTGFVRCNTSRTPLATDEVTCTPTGQECPITAMERVTNAVAASYVGTCAPNDSWGTGFTLCVKRDGLAPPVVRVLLSRAAHIRMCFATRPLADVHALCAGAVRLAHPVRLRQQVPAVPPLCAIPPCLR